MTIEIFGGRGLYICGKFRDYNFSRAMTPPIAWCGRHFPEEEGPLMRSVDAGEDVACKYINVAVEEYSGKLYGVGVLLGTERSIVNYKQKRR